jgi:poly(3-hydroxybutyrate) depolymerase
MVLDRRVTWAAFALATVTATPAAARDVAGVACASPPPLHCAPSGCTNELVATPGNATDPKTGRKFFLDYPCDLKPGEKVTFVLNLHGGGSIGNWQRHYFPIHDLKEKHRLVIATPSGSDLGWNPAKDDEHLRNVVEQVETAFGRENIKAFWLAGHSLGGQTSNRLLVTDFYKSRLKGWVSLSGGRLGSKREDIRAPIPGRVGAPPAPPSGAPPGPMRLAADASVLPDFAFSHIYEAGEHEYPDSKGPPSGSPWAEKLGCRAQAAPSDVVDTQAGYVQDSRVQANPNKVWGLAPRPGTAKVYAYPGCRDGRVVADIVRLDKGHTEGLEPKITEAIVMLMLSAR